MIFTWALPAWFCQLVQQLLVCLLMIVLYDLMIYFESPNKESSANLKVSKSLSRVYYNVIKVATQKMPNVSNGDIGFPEELKNLLATMVQS